ncbi:MAG: peptidoglycan-binding protein [Ruminococcus sp.]|nr:peptidoglycan-binding protein [Ruminococcus sp.]
MVYHFLGGVFLWHIQSSKKTITSGNCRAICTVSPTFATCRTSLPDGIYGPRTAEAVRAFQKQNGMRPTGEVDSGA